LLLTFAIPQRDVRPLAESLISKFGNLDNVLSANIDVLCQIDGLKKHSAVLLKLVESPPP
jgi:DNA repair protein RadC